MRAACFELIGVDLHSVTGVVQFTDMPLFRRSFDRRQAVARPAAAHDYAAISALAHHATRRYLTSQPDEVADLVQYEPTAVLEYDGRLVAAAQAGWRIPPMAWLRALLVDYRIEAGAALPLLLPQLHQLLPGRGVMAAYITLDDWSAPWATRPLEQIGYRHVMNVLGYDKFRMDYPSPGNQAVVVRRARPEDMRGVLHVDAICFPTPWGKGEEILGPALLNAPYFSVAEFGGEIIGYTYLTVHYAGLHAHLVRIAVDPRFQGRAVGVRLLAEVVRFCRGHRVETLSLNTQDYNVQAQRLYEWFGFEPNGESQAVLGIDGLGQSARAR